MEHGKLDASLLDGADDAGSVTSGEAGKSAQTLCFLRIKIIINSD
jgi:hypothetical protein